MIATLPDNHNLIVKLHPNLVQQEAFKVETLIEKYQGKQNLLFLTEFPPVYPLLALVDVYIGDMSSVGYDFLAFDRPMFFLNQNLRDRENDMGLYLFRCGIEIPPEEYKNIHKAIEDFFQYELRNFSEVRKDVNAYAFGHPRLLEDLKKEIARLYTLFPEKGLNFY